MPTIIRHTGIRVDIIPGDHVPPHVHVYGGGGQAVISLDLLKVRDVRGMRPADVARARRLVAENRDKLLRKWGTWNGKG